MCLLVDNNLLAEIKLLHDLVITSFELCLYTERIISTKWTIDQHDYSGIVIFQIILKNITSQRRSHRQLNGLMDHLGEYLE